MNPKMFQNRSFSSKIRWRIRYFSNKKICFHESLYVDGLHKIIGFSFQMCTFHAKYTFSSFHVCRWNKKCCEIVYFHRKFIENSSIAKACRSTEPPNAMPKSRHIVDSCTLLFTTSRSIEAPKHNAQIETPSILALSFSRRPGRQKVRNTIPKSRLRSTQSKKISLFNECGPPRGGQPRNLYPMKNKNHICRFVEKKRE